MFGATPAPQSESTPLHPRSPYAVSTVAANCFAINYREAYCIFVSNRILFNHESPRRAETFVTRKITRAVGRIKVGLQQQLFLGNLDAKREWGFAGDYVEAMWRVLHAEKLGDVVIATGETHSVREFVEKAFGRVGLDWEKHVAYNPRYSRPTEVDLVQGGATKARLELDWVPKLTFDGLVQMMVDTDFLLAELEASHRCMPMARPSHPFPMVTH